MGTDGRAVTQSGVVDSTGLEHRHSSDHYSRAIKHQRPDLRKTGWVKLSVLAHAESHLIVGAVVNRGPSADYPQFRTLLLESCSLMRFTRVMADRGYDCEANHRIAREHYGVKSTIIPLIPNRHRSDALVGKYRRQMLKSFPRKAYNQRVQAESVFSAYKRRLGSALTARKWVSRSHECLLRVLTYNLLILGGAAEA